MIIEFFGAPGSGKTTIARALVRRLQERGYDVQLTLSYSPGERGVSFDPSGLFDGLQRFARAAIDIVLLLRHPLLHANHARTAARLIGDLPPKSIIWFLRFSQYIFRLSMLWHAARRQPKIFIFDQAFVQAACSLAIFNRTADIGKIKRALNFIPKSDLIVGVDAPADMLMQRLQDRRKKQSLIERLLEADINTNLKFQPIAKQATELLQARTTSVISLCTNGASLEQILEIIEPKVMDAVNGQAEHGAAEREAAHARSPATELVPMADSVEFPQTVPSPPTSDPDVPPAGTAAEVVHQLSWATISAFCVYVGGAGLTSAAQFIIARLAHANSYGIYSYVAAYVTLLSYGCTLGFTALILRYAPTYATTNEWGLARGVISFAIKRAGLAAAAAAGIGILLVTLLWHGMKPEVATTAVFGLLAVPLITLQLIGASIVRVFGGVFSALFPERIGRDGLLLLFIVSMYFMSHHVSATLVMFGLLMSSAAALALVTYVARRREFDEIRRAKVAFRAAEWWKFSVPIMVMMAMEIIITRNAVILLGWSGRTEEAGAFALCFNLAMLLQLPRAAVGTYFSPRASELCARQDYGRLQALFTRASLLSVGGAAVIALPVLLATEPLLRLFGSEFASAAPIAQVLVLGQLFAATAGPQQNLLMMTGHERPAAIMMSGFAVLNVVLCAIAIQYYGATGAAIATASVVVVWNIAMAFFIRAKLGLAVGPGMHKFGRRRVVRGLFAQPWRARMDSDGYRSSHQMQAAANGYVRTYQTGYYAALWKCVECPLLEDTFRRLGGADRSCLDFACGTGRITTVAGRYFGKVVGVDISEPMLRYAPHLPHVDYLCTDITRCADVTRGRLARSFDVATAFRFFLNAEPELREAALIALRRHLVEGGWLICDIHMVASAPIGILYRVWDRLRGKAHHKTLRVSEFVQLLQAHGFTVEQVEPYGYWPRPGPFLSKICEVMVGPFEKMCKALNVPGAIAQNVMIVARKS